MGDHFLQSTYNAIMIVAEFGVKDLYSITNVHFEDVRVDGTGTSVLSARAAGSASFENVDARNVGTVGINNCGSFHFTPAGSEWSATDLGGNDSTGTNTTGALVCAVGAAEHDHMRRPSAGGAASRAFGLAVASRTPGSCGTGATRFRFRCAIINNQRPHAADTARSRRA